jgi:hypothetical protein
MQYAKTRKLIEGLGLSNTIVRLYEGQTLSESIFQVVGQGI